jgi:hypothetical protein
MLPRDLKPEHFNAYAPEAKRLATSYIATFQRLPLSFLPSLLREVCEYDFKFPAERQSLERELANLSSLSGPQLQEWFHGFDALRLSPALENFAWAASPARFVEQLSSYLWTTHQLDAFRMSANEYANRLQSVMPPESPPIARLGISIIGHGVAAYVNPLFRNLRAHGVYFTRVNPENGLKVLLDTVVARAKRQPVRYGHWYIDGGEPATHDDAITCTSYNSLEPVRRVLLRKIEEQTQRPGMGPEALRTFLAGLTPSDLGMDKAGDPVLQRFQMKLLTEGSGTQIFSTSFAQWAAREALRRAQPLTILVRFAMRQRQRPMNELLSGNVPHPEADPIGSLIDGDMGAYYNWINQQRLPGAEKSSFLVWFEGHNQALAIGPALPRGTESNSDATLHELLNWQT